jgi:hypothetical protein
MMLIIVNISCNKNEKENQDCIDSYFQNHPDLVVYTNQQLQCETFVSTIEIKGNLYFYGSCNCCDMILRLYDCNNVEASDKIYDCFGSNYASIKIIGYYP